MVVTIKKTTVIVIEANTEEATEAENFFVSGSSLLIKKGPLCSLRELGDMGKYYEGLKKVSSRKSLRAFTCLLVLHQ
jgi:hypothetical protein